jgi:hypothetical protein
MPLDATAKFRLSRAYYEQLRQDWIRYVSRWRRLTLPLGVLLILIGLWMFFTEGTPKILAFAFAVTGLVQIIQHLMHQRRWIQARLVEKSFDHEVEIHFTDSKITIHGPQSSGFCTWDAFQRCLKTPRGLFLWPRKGLNIYVPDSALTPPEAKAEIANRIGTGQNRG